MFKSLKERAIKTFTGKKFLRSVLLIALACLVIIGMFRLGKVFGFLLVFPWFVSKLENAGVNIWLARAISVPIAVLIVMCISWLFSFSKEKRMRGLIVGTCIYCLWFFVLFAIQKDYNFNPLTGEPLKHYAATPYGYVEVPAKWKVHPTFGTPVIKGTRELAISKAIEKKGLPELSRIEPTRDSVFFSPDGQPLVWYYQHPDGQIDLFPRPGVHPQLGVQLNPITPAIVAEIFKQIEKGGDYVRTYSSDKLYVPSFEGLKKLHETLKKSRIK